jgi:hypothetical protein
MIGHTPANQLGAWKLHWFIRPKGRQAREKDETISYGVLDPSALGRRADHRTET